MAFNSICLYLINSCVSVQQLIAIKINGRDVAKLRTGYKVLNSMTGFASLSGDNGGGKWDWELRSLNGKGLDFRVRLPDGFEALEPLMRAEAKRHLSRGNVTASLKYVDRGGVGFAQVQPDGLAAAMEALAAIEAAAEAGGFNLAPMNAADLTTIPGVLGGASDITSGVPDEVKAQVPELFALFVAMRQTEGAALGEILTGQLATVEDLIGQATTTAEARAARSGDILREKVAALVDASDQSDPARLQQELAILAVKADVTEEIDRLRAHVDAARGLLAAGGAIGRKLDFLMQEFNREANTLCSKSGSTELTQIGMDLKVLIDQMREQVQNLE